MLACDTASSGHSIAFLGMEAPRYTSYPTAHHFSQPFANGVYRKWLEGIADGMTISAYVHIPFCKEMCWFCGCHTKMTKRYEPIARYVQVLLREIALVGEQVRGRGRLVNVHFGGGSPSLLAPEDFRAIMDALAEAFGRMPEGELAIELDPRTTTPEGVVAYAALGCNRVSIGIQDFDPKVQQAINRIQPYAMVGDVVAQVRAAGIGAINCDLVYGLPHQDWACFRDTLEKTLSFAPSRLSLFSYAHMPQVKKHQRLIEEAWLPGVQERLGIYMQACALLGERGYVMVGMDHFARPEDPLAQAMQAQTMRRNFQGYVVDDTDVLIGFGCSAISQFPEGYAQNSASTHEYVALVGQGRFATLRGWENRGDDALRKQVIDAFMCFMEADIGAICAQAGVVEEYFAPEMEALGPYVQQGIVVVEGARVRVVSPYRMAARVVASVFDAYRGAVEARYSKVA